MATERLYYENQYTRSFSSRVVSCEREGGVWLVTLESTAFYPEGGGQPGDIGTLGAAGVTDTQERDGEVIHLCTAPLEPGSPVSGEIDWPRRFDFMQQHSGEHIVSGLVHARFGYDNVGFHMGAETTAIDFSGELGWNELMDIERAANEKLWENLPVEVSWPCAGELARLDYRSKKELHGAVRIVSVPGADVCACCGTHVARTGEIGLIKIISAQKLRGGTRAELLCGRRAYDHVCRASEQNRQISMLLSAKAEETAAAVARVQSELDSTKYRLYGCEEQLFRALTRALDGRGEKPLFADGLAPDGVRRLAAAAAEACAGRAAVFSGSDGEGYKYALMRPADELVGLTKRMNAALNGRGGGRPPLAQGSVQASRAEIEEFFK